MSTNTTYIPTEISLKNGKTYSVHIQKFIGNTFVAVKETKKLRQKYTRPNFIVRRIECCVTIYKL